MKKCLITTVLGVVISTTGFFAQQLDNTFSTDGIVFTGLGNLHDYGEGMAIQADGKIVVVGMSEIDTMGWIMVYTGVARYNVDGSLDNSFSTDGVLTIDTIGGFSSSYARAVSIQTDGKIVVAGSVNNNISTFFGLFRFNTDGSLDSSFGGDGRVTTAIGTSTMGTSFDVPLTMAIQTEGKIVVAGYSADSLGYYNSAIARYNTDGSLDNSFSTDGMLITYMGLNDFILSIAIQPDGKIVTAGYAGPNSLNCDIALARYNIDGSLDNSFSTDGKVFTDIEISDKASSMAIQLDGKIIVAGNSNSDFLLVRYNNDGNLDNGFGTNGIVITPIDNTSEAKSVAITSSGKIIAAGYTTDGFDSDFALTRYNTNGSLDTSFSTDGILTTDIGSAYDEANAIAIQSDSKIVLAGTFFNGLNTDFAVVRYLSGSNMGIINFPISANSVLIYPNPVADMVMLKYTLIQEENISIKLLDMQGRLLKTFIDNEQQHGDQIIQLSIPNNLPSGNYFIVISNSKEKISVKIIK